MPRAAVSAATANGHRPGLLTDGELAAWVATVDASDPLLRRFAEDVDALAERAGVPARFAAVALLRVAAESLEPAGARPEAPER